MAVKKKGMYIVHSQSIVEMIWKCINSSIKYQLCYTPYFLDAGTSTLSYLFLTQMAPGKAIWPFYNCVASE